MVSYDELNKRLGELTDARFKDFEQELLRGNASIELNRVRCSSPDDRWRGIPAVRVPPRGAVTDTKHKRASTRERPQRPQRRPG